MMATQDTGLFREGQWGGGGRGIEVVIASLPRYRVRSRVEELIDYLLRNAGVKTSGRAH